MEGEVRSRADKEACAVATVRGSLPLVGYGKGLHLASVGGSVGLPRSRHRTGILLLGLLCLFAHCARVEAGYVCTTKMSLWDIVSPMGERITSYRQIDSSSCERAYDGGVQGGRGSRREGRGGGREQIPNDGGLNDDGRNPADTSMCRGNPIIVPTGNKIEPAQDFATYGQMPLFMSRTWNQQWDGVGLLGYHWLSNFDYRLSFNTRSPFGQAEGCYARPSLPACSAPANNSEIS